LKRLDAGDHSADTPGISWLVSSNAERNSSMAWKKADGENCVVYIRSSSEIIGFEGASTCLTFVFEKEFDGMSSNIR
jgi:hypothetical protein